MVGRLCYRSSSANLIMPGRQAASSNLPPFTGTASGQRWPVRIRPQPSETEPRGLRSYSADKLNVRAVLTVGLATDVELPPDRLP